MEIEKVMIPIEKIINNSEECFAHVAKDNKQKETLKEHTERCQKYWKNLVEKKNLTEILEEFEKWNASGMERYVQQYLHCYMFCCFMYILLHNDCICYSRIRL